MTIEDGATVRNNGTGSSMIETGFQNSGQYQDYQDEHSPKTVINGGTFIGGLCNIKVDDCGEVIINDGTFTALALSAATLYNWNKLTVNGGTFNSATSILWNGYCDATDDIGVATTNGGTFTCTNIIIRSGGDAYLGKGLVSIYGGYFTETGIINDDTYTGVEISGGYFTSDPSTYVVDGMTVSASSVEGYDYTVGYTVTFNSNDGSAVDTQTVVPGDKVTAPTDPTLTGYTFKG